MEETLRAAGNEAAVRTPATRPAGAMAQCVDALRIVTDPRLPVRLRVRTSAALVNHLDDAAASMPDELRLRQVADAYDAALHEQLLPTLAGLGSELVDWAELNRFERLRVIDTFEHQIHPVLTPLAVDAAHPFPRVPDRSVSLALRVREPSAHRTRFVCITLPAHRPRFVAVHAGRVVPTESVVLALLPRLVAGVELEESGCFRVTRSGGAVVRLEVEQRTTAEMTDLLGARFAVPDSRIFRVRSPLAMGAPMAELPAEGLP
ncbi:MAG TPA: hypothetical protein VFH38_07295 [Jatrophihabitans sp.]|nr:hypothetical protein [Jatrophihabitans sp.]